MLARISFRQVSLGARVYARSYTSSVKEGSVAASKGLDVLGSESLLIQ
jgi:hypothetical protein